MKICLNSCLIFLVMMGTSLWAQEKPLQNPKEYLQQISSHTQNIRSLKATFSQEKVLSFLEEPIRSEGKFYFSQPNKIRWEYEKPYSYVMIMNHGLLTVKDGGDEYATDLSSNKMFEQLNALISGSIQGKLLEEGDHYQQSYFENETSIIIRFEPKQEDLKAYLQQIEIYFDKVKWDVNQLIMVEPGGDYTKIEFLNRIINTEISDDVFK